MAGCTQAVSTNQGAHAMYEEEEQEQQERSGRISGLSQRDVENQNTTVAQSMERGLVREHGFSCGATDQYLSLRACK